VGGGPGGFLLPFRLLGSGASWGDITSCPPPLGFLSLAPLRPGLGWVGGGGGLGRSSELAGYWFLGLLQPLWPEKALGGAGGGTQGSRKLS
jgi:hypothetical protein